MLIRAKKFKLKKLKKIFSGGEGGKRRRSSIAHLTELLKDWGIRDKDKLRSNTVDRG